MSPLPSYEKLGLFYLGRTVRPDGSEGEEYLYDAKDLTTHAVIVGMTGSGKTGLGITLLEEAAIDGIPVLAIDPKGDLGNLLLTFPELRAEDFRPWVEPSAATAAGQGVEEHAAAVAKTWQDGLAAWAEPPERVAKVAAVDRAIYTPASDAGLPLTVLKSFAAPPPAVLVDAETMREAVSAAAAGLLSLAGVESDPLVGREHVLVATILDTSWRAGRDLSIADLIRAAQAPPFDKVGAFDLETFFPAKDRTALALRLNALLASPGFSGWLKGEPLDVGRLLYTPEGKPRVAVVSIAHLSEAERMFFVTLLLGEVLAWVRAQPGTSSLRAVLYMDEIAGYFPPIGEPPSKRPMLTLLKQARAYGLGVVLSTQNPVDLDYKGLSNAGTWFLGRLQTERDKARVLEGLEGASTAAGRAFDRQAVEATLAGLAPRTFLVNNVHEDVPVVLKTRWTLSYLRGPMTRSQIATLTAARKTAEPPQTSAPAAEAPSKAPATAPAPAAASAATRPTLPPAVEEYVLSMAASSGGSLAYRPAWLGRVRLHFVKTGAAGIDLWDERTLLLPADAAAWDDAEPLDGDTLRPTDAAAPRGTFDDVPAAMLNAKSYAAQAKALKEAAYRTQTLTLRRCAPLAETAGPGESEAAFRARLAHPAREARDAAVEALRKKYAPKLASLDKRLKAAGQRVEREKGQATRAALESAVAVGSTLLGALFGRKTFSVTNAGKAASAARGIGRAAEQRSDVGRANESLEDVKAEIARLEEELKAEADRVAASFDPQALELEELSLTPRKSDIQVAPVAVAWCPFTTGPQGFPEPAWKKANAPS